MALMAAFKTLKEASLDFDSELKQISRNLLSARRSEVVEEVIAKKLRDLSLFSSKYRLLHAKETCRVSPLIEERVHNGADVISEYEEATQRRVLDGAVVKSLSLKRAVQALFSTPKENLDPQLFDRLLKIMSSLQRLHSLDIELRQVDASLLEKQKEEDRLRTQWDTTLGAMRDQFATATAGQDIDTSGPHYKKLNRLVSKMQIMRLLMCQLVTAPTKYDWLADPVRRINALAVTREHPTVEGFVYWDD